MYRSAAKRLLLRAAYAANCNLSLRVPYVRPVGKLSRYSTAANSHFAGNQTPHTSQNFHPESDASSASTAEEGKGENQGRARVNYEDEQVRVLQASLRHVLRLGWTEAAMIAGAKEVGVSPAIVGSFPRKEAALVEFFMDDCLQRLIDRIESDEELKSLAPSKQICRLIKTRLAMQAPYISKWPQALSIQAQPANIPTSFKQRAMLVDEIWHAAGDGDADIDWYVKRTVLGGIYSTAELYMLTDNSPDFRSTWSFVDERVCDAFDLKKTVQEAKYLAEAVGAGMGNSFQGFVKKVFQG